jgi:lysophospholipase L1-like esterase
MKFMATFKMLHGDETNISLDVTPFHEGWAYITSNGYYYVDLNVGTLESPNNQRIKLNANNAEMLTGKTLEEIQKSINYNDLLDKPTLGALAEKDAINKDDVGLDNVDNIKQYSAQNPPPYPVTSVNGQTGAVVLEIEGELKDELKEYIDSEIEKVTPVKGVDYFDGKDGKTAYQYAQDGGYMGTAEAFANDINPDTMKAELNAYIATELAKRGQLKPEFANTVDDCTDTSKLYVLPDGYIYAYMNQYMKVKHNANDGTGLLNQRVGGTWGNTTAAASGVWTSPLIQIDPTVMAPVDSRDDTIVTISGIDKIVPAFNGSSIWVYYYKQNGTQMFAQKGSAMASIGNDSEITLPLTFKLKDTNHFLDNNWATVYGVRIMIGVSTSGNITQSDVSSLVVNVPFYDQQGMVTGWLSTGHMFNTDDYGQAIEKNAADISVLKSEVSTLKENGAKPLSSGAKWYAIGDSITYGLYSTSETAYSQPVIGKRWVDYVAQYNGYELTNLGVSGSGFVSGKTFRTIVNENDFSSVDLVTIMLGINDWKNESAINKVGTMDDDISAGGTIVSELRYGLEKIIADNPYCKIILITPINAKIGSRGTEATNWAYGFSGVITPCGSLKNFGDKLKEVCEYYGIQVVDMTNSSVVNRKSITTVLPDGIHPNLDCYKALGLELARKITFA